MADPERTDRSAKRREAQVRAYFHASDSGEFDKAREMLAPDVVFRFGNAEEKHGAESVAAGRKRLREVVADVEHDVRAVHVSGDGRYATAELEMTYRRHDGRSIEVPACVVFGFDGDRIAEYRIYVDQEDLHEPAAQAERSGPAGTRP